MSICQFGEVDGQHINEITLGTTDAGITAKVITWGATLNDLKVRLADGKYQRVVLGLNNIADYVAYSSHMGAIAGRVANRIADGSFSLDGKKYELDRNQAGRHTLHGGKQGFGRKIWQMTDHDSSSVTLTLISPDGDNGFPGNVETKCVYKLREPGILRVELSAIADKPTPINLAHHSYFNLDGQVTILQHRLSVEADYYTPTNDDLIPTGEISSVCSTANDFRDDRTIYFSDSKAGSPVHYDVNFVLRRDRLECSGIDGLPLAHAATVSSPINNLTLCVWTTEPGLQFYDAGMLNVPVAGLDNAKYIPHAGLCLEAQNFPNAINQPQFPNSILRPGETYQQVTEYRFNQI